MSFQHSTVSSLAVRSTPPLCSEASGQPGQTGSTGEAVPGSTELAETRYSIRVAQEPGKPCALCLELTGSGPVGYYDDEPICDMCLLKGCVDLGVVLGLVAITRECGALLPQSAEQVKEASAELFVFAGFFERFAQRFGPRRRLVLPDSLGGRGPN